MGGSYADGSDAVRYFDEGKNLSMHEAEMMGDVAEHSLFMTMIPWTKLMRLRTVLAEEAHVMPV